MRTKIVLKYSLILLLALAAGSMFIEPRKLPASILVGGVLGLANFKGLTFGLEALLGTQRPAGKLMFLGIFRLFIVMTIIIVLAWLRLVDLIGLLVGFTTVLVVVILEGFRSARQAVDNKESHLK
jgi:hypothetical protein